MLGSKQRAFLKSLSNKTEAVLQIGKAGVSPSFTENLILALKAREIVKVSVLNNCAFDIHEMADVLSERTKSEVVQILGNKIVFYKKAQNPVIVLPKD